MFGSSIFVSIVIFMLIHRNGLTLRVHELQFLGCFREGLDTASRDLLHDVRNDFEECATYCILQDALVFGMTDDGSCACQLASYDMYDGFIKDWCRNPCKGRSTYSNEYSCGGGVIFMSYYRVCPPYTFGEQCENFCMCESSMCHGISGICSNKGCLDPTTDESNNEDYSICPRINCQRLTGQCLTLCQSGSARFANLTNCTCDVGYQIDALTLSCEDVNECAQPSTKDCDICLNVPGSFKCLCHPPNVIARFPDRPICRPPPLFDDVCSNCTKDKVCEILDKRAKCLCPHGLIETAGERVCYHRIRCIDLIYCHICDIEVDYIVCRCRPGYILVDNYVCMDFLEEENREAVLHSNVLLRIFSSTKWRCPDRRSTSYFT